MKPRAFVQWKKKQDLIGIIWVHKKWSDNIEFLNNYRRETTCTRAMEKTAPYRHYLSTCKKKLFLWFQKGETGRTLTRTCGTFSNFHLFTTILYKIVIFFLQFLYFFALIWTKIYLFHPIISNPDNLGWNRGQFQTSFTETVHGFKKLSQFHWNWTQKKALFFVPFWHKIA